MREEFDGHSNHGNRSIDAVEADRTKDVVQTVEDVSDPPTNFVDRSLNDVHIGRVDEASRARSSEQPNEELPGSQEFRDGLSARDALTSIVVTGGEAGQTPNVTLASSAGLAQTIDTTVMQWRRRRVWHRAEKSLTLQAKAVCRGLAHEGSKTEAEAIYKDAIGKQATPAGVLAYAAIFPLIDARAVIETQRKAVEKRLEKLASELPCAEWIRQTRGVGLGSLAAIVGEAGDLSRYANPAKLWKRMGLAVMPDGRQRRVAGDAALVHGYNPERRSVMWVIGDCIVKQGRELRELYLERKVYEATKSDKPIVAHARAKRYVEKRLLKLLWQQWRREVGGQHARDDHSCAAAPSTSSA